MEHPDAGRILTVDQVAKLLQVDRQTVERELKRGKLQGFKVGRVWRITERALLRYMGLEEDQHQDQAARQDERP